ncbi:MAG: hypothetical protein ABI689_09525 [Thermoanaerobaculia bacterium]
MTFILASRQFAVSRADFVFVGPRWAGGKVGFGTKPSITNQ